MIINDTVLTSEGKKILADLELVQDFKLEFTKVILEDTEEDIKQEVGISGIRLQDENTAIIEVAANSFDLEAGYYIRKIGLFALDRAEKEVLYSSAITSEPDFFSPDTPTTLTLEFVIPIINPEKLAIKVGKDEYLLAEEYEKYKPLLESINKITKFRTIYYDGNKLLGTTPKIGEIKNGESISTSDEVILKNDKSTIQRSFSDYYKVTEDFDIRGIQNKKAMISIAEI